MNIQALISILIMFFAATSIFAKEENGECGLSISPDHFASAYKGYVKSIQKDPNQIYLVMINGCRIPWFSSHPLTFEEKLENPTLSDMVSIPYPAYRDLSIEPHHNEDPGRCRNVDFLKAVYGDSRKSVENNLIKVRWMPKTLVNKPVYLLFNRQNNAAASLQKVSEELDTLSPDLKKYVLDIIPRDCTYNWRQIAASDRLSAHSFGIAIDVAEQYSNYWYWDLGAMPKESELSSQVEIKYRNKIPKKIVDIFEKYGFIWGGRWYHYDTMHFEYRPELLLFATKNV